jgi:hypothetical protein
MSKSSKSPLSSSRQDQVLAGLLPEPLRLALNFFVAVFFVASFAATIVIFLWCAHYFLPGRVCAFCRGFSSSHL